MGQTLGSINPFAKKTVAAEVVAAPAEKLQPVAAAPVGVSAAPSTLATAAPAKEPAKEPAEEKAGIISRICSAVVKVVTFPFVVLKAVFIDFPRYVYNTPARHAAQKAEAAAVAEREAAEKAAAERAAADKAAYLSTVRGRFWKMLGRV